MTTLNRRKLRYTVGAQSLPVGTRKSVLAMAISMFVTQIGVLSCVPKAYASAESKDEYEFDLSLLHVRDSQSADLTRFVDGATVLPGTYMTAIYVNGSFVENRQLTFKAAEGSAVTPCLTLDLVQGIAFDYSKLPDGLIPKNGDKEMCVNLVEKIPAAKLNYDAGEQQLDVLIPQLYMKKNARGYISSEFWDDGVSAGMLAYNVNGFSSESNGYRTNSTYAGLNAGLNVGSWYLRHNGSYSWSTDGQGKYEAINTYVQHDIASLQGRVQAGEANTTGTVFDTLPFTGIQLATDDRMLPDSLRGYAPEIRGIANTNARVTVRQSGQIIYETTVPPGEFLINDLYPTGYGGDLQVSVREADGTESKFLVPYSSVAQLLRPGSSRYSITAGKLRNDYLEEKPALLQGTYQRGLTNTITGYGGIQASQNYYSLQIGFALGTPLGAFALDATQARTQLDSGITESGEAQPSETKTGQSYRLTYSKNISETGSNISVAAYRFSTDGYMDFLSAAQTRDAISEGLSADTVRRAKNRFTVTASQALPDDYGQFYLSASTQNYWNMNGNDQQYQFGYNNRYKLITYGVSFNRTFSNIGDEQDSMLLSVSLPLGGDTRSQQLRMEVANDSDGRVSERATLSGNAGKDNQGSYGVSVANANQGVGQSGSVNGSYRTPATALNGSYSVGNDYSSASAGASGTIVAHSGGVTFSPYTSETFALAEAKGAEGAKVSSSPGVEIDSNGYALVPSLNPYQLNDITLDPNGIPDEVELTNTLQKVAPNAGAIVKVNFQTKFGIPLLIDATSNGETLPFGAEVLDNDGNNIGSVGQAGMIYARVQQAQGKLFVRWGDSEQCSLSYQAKDPESNPGTQRFAGDCRMLKSKDIFGPRTLATTP